MELLRIKNLSIHRDLAIPVVSFTFNIFFALEASDGSLLKKSFHFSKPCFEWSKLFSFKLEEFDLFWLDLLKSLSIKFDWLICAREELFSIELFGQVPEPFSRFLFFFLGWLDWLLWLDRLLRFIDLLWLDWFLWIINLLWLNL